MIVGIADLHALGPLDHLGAEFLVNGFLHNDAGSCHAHLSLMVERTIPRQMYRLVHLKISQHDHGVFAAQFHCIALEVFGRSLGYFNTHLTGASKCHRLNGGMLHQTITNFATFAGDHIQHTGRKSRFVEHLSYQ